jgi:vacuolar-type H+-ATPase subunit H
LAKSLAEQAPMSVAPEIEVAKEDAIVELQTAIQNAIAQRDITTATQDMMHQGLDSKIDKTMDKILAKRKTKFQTIQQDMENLIERRRTKFESHVEVFIENETGNREEPTLHQCLTIALAEAAKQMSNTKEDAKKAVDDYIAMQKQELEDEIDKIRRNMSNGHNSQEHNYTPMPPHSSHTDHQDTTHEAPWKRQVTLNRNSLQVTSNIPYFEGRLYSTTSPQDQLESRGTTLSLDPTVHEETLQKITRILFGKLLETIPEECTAL